MSGQFTQRDRAVGAVFRLLEAERSWELTYRSPERAAQEAVAALGEADAHDLLELPGGHSRSGSRALHDRRPA